MLNRSIWDVLHRCRQLFDGYLYLLNFFLPLMWTRSTMNYGVLCNVKLWYIRILHPFPVTCSLFYFIFFFASTEYKCFITVSTVQPYICYQSSLYFAGCHRFLFQACLHATRLLYVATIKVTSRSTSILSHLLFFQLHQLKKVNN
jgi:hypothetical protein